jgi:sugar phosphate isomerase/epimerase
VDLFLNTATVQPASLEEKLGIAARAGYAGVELFADELEPILADSGGPQHLIDLLSAHGLKVRRLLPPRRLYAWHAARPHSFLDYQEEFDRVFTLAAGLGVSAIILPVTSCQGTVADTRQNFAAVCDWARAFDLLVGYEPVGHTGKTSRVREAWDLVRSVERPNAGLFLDMFHFFRAGCTADDLRDIPPDRVFGVHLCDAIPLPRENLLGFRHRAVPGDGILPFDALLRLFWQAGYRDYFGVEILNPDLWAGDLEGLASRAARACQTAFASLLGAPAGAPDTAYP